LLARFTAKSCSERRFESRYWPIRLRKASGASHPTAERLSFCLIDFRSFISAGATLASPEMQLASQRIRRIQFCVKKSV
jgi:hypothetical protein